MTAPHLILYGMSASLYTGKVRAYLLHHGLPFEERGAGHPEFLNHIVPQIGRWIIPVLVLPDGTVLQDGTSIIDHFETTGQGRFSIVPDDPVLRSVAHLFELFGGEGLLRPAMHYRWNFDAGNLDFLKVSFSEAFSPGLNPDQQAAMFDQASGRMRQAAAAFGVSAESEAVIEARYTEFLSLFDAHLSQHAFLLGGRPTLGDYGLMNGLYAHLARDPHPALIMKRDAPRIFAWTERMMRPPRDTHFITGGSEGLVDTIPSSLRSLMRFVADDFLPELSAHIAFANQWLEDQFEGQVKSQLPNSRQDGIKRSIGMAQFDWHGLSLKTAVMPYRFWMQQRLTDHLEQCEPTTQSAIRELFAQTGLNDMLDLRVRRRVERRDNREYWEDEIAP